MLTLQFSKPNISRIPINPSMEYLTALFKMAIVLYDLPQAEPRVIMSETMKPNSTLHEVPYRY